MTAQGLLKLHELTVNGEKRKYWLQKPSSIIKVSDPEATKLLPLIIVLHGSFMSSKRMMYFSEFSELATCFNIV
jgi:poly(3-hydroxybutyrate) depolymerase